MSGLIRIRWGWFFGMATWGAIGFATALWAIAFSTNCATGRGGLPQSPDEPLQSRAVITDWVTLTDPETQHQSSRRTREQSHTREHPHKDSSANPPNQILEAQGWIVDKNGDVELVAFAPTATSHNPRFTPASCQGERK